MSKFEEQIQQSAQRLRARENAGMNVAPSPLTPSSRLSWGWVTTPIAAAIGLVAGMFVPRMGQPSGMMLLPEVQTVRVVDTVMKNVVVHDTVYVPQPSPDHIASTSERDVPQTDGMLSPDTMGRCILDDGVDYSLLASF